MKLGEAMLLFPGRKENKSGEVIKIPQKRRVNRNNSFIENIANKWPIVE